MRYINLRLLTYLLTYLLIHELTNEVTFLNVKQSEEPLQPESESQSQESSAHPLTHTEYILVPAANPSLLYSPILTLLTDLLPNADAYIRSKVAGPKVTGPNWLGQKWQVTQPCSGRSQSDRSPGRTTRSQGNTSLQLTCGKWTK